MLGHHVSRAARLALSSHRLFVSSAADPTQAWCSREAGVSMSLASQFVMVKLNRLVTVPPAPVARIVTV